MTATYHLAPVPGGQTLLYGSDVVAKIYSHTHAGLLAGLLVAQPDILDLLHRLKIHNRTGPLAADVTAMIAKLEAL